MPKRTGKGFEQNIPQYSMLQENTVSNLTQTNEIVSFKYRRVMYFKELQEFLQEDSEQSSILYLLYSVAENEVTFTLDI